MRNGLNILHLEDDRLDAELIRDTLSSQGIFANIFAVETEAGFRASLADGRVDLVLSDYSLPGFNGMTALKITRGINEELPFIFVSGTIGEEIAIESLKSGATDYVLKQGLQRLGLSVHRALNEVKERQRSRLKDVALRNSEARYKLLFESSPLPMWVYDLETLAFLDVNKAARQHYGYSRAEFLRMTVKDIRPPEDVPLLLENVHQARKGLHKSGTWRHLKRDGSVIYVEITSNGIESGGQKAALVLANDVTERKRVEENLRLKSAALEAAGNAIMITDAKGKIIWVNPAFSETTGYSAEEALGQTPRLIKSGKQDKSFYKQMWNTILSGEVWHNTIVNRRKDGTLNDEDLTITPIVNGDGKITHFIGIKQDITELKRTESALKGTNERFQEALADVHTKSDELAAMTQQLWQASKLATMGELAASVAHELNNPLATLALHAESLLAGLRVDDEKRRSLEVIDQEIERMASLVSNLLLFSRRSHQQISTINIAEELQNSLEFIHYHLRSHRINVRTDLAQDLPNVQGDRQQLRQVFLNLVTNAGDAMPEGGTLTVSARQQVVESGAHTVVIEFSDTGMGISPDDLPKLWEPFFTTKPEGKGTGLGLPICRRTVEEHRGTINIESQPGRGTSVRIILPAIERNE